MKKAMVALCASLITIGAFAQWKPAGDRIKTEWADKIKGLYVNDPDQYQFWPIWQTFIDNSNGMLVNSSNYQ